MSEAMIHNTLTSRDGIEITEVDPATAYVGTADGMGYGPLPDATTGEPTYHGLTDEEWQDMPPTGTDEFDGELPTCLNASDECAGPVKYRMPLSGTGKPFPRCDKHWSDRLDEQDRINRMYPYRQPADFDPLYAGESWDEDQ